MMFVIFNDFFKKRFKLSSIQNYWVEDECLFLVVDYSAEEPITLEYDSHLKAEKEIKRLDLLLNTQNLK